MGIVNWLSTHGFPWLGPGTDQSKSALLELEREHVKSNLGGIGSKMWWLPYHDSLTGETATMRAAYRHMLRDPSVKAALMDKVLTVAALDTSVQPGGDTPKDQEGADLCQYAIDHLPGGLRGLVESVILPGLIDGYSITEKVYRLEPRGQFARKLLPAQLKSKDSNHFRIEIDEYKNITGLIGMLYNNGQRFDPSLFIVWQHLPIFSNPSGMSDMRAAYRAYWMIDTAWKLRAIYLEKYSAGPMIKGTYTDPGSQKTALEKALEQAKASTWISIPSGALVEAMSLAQSGTADFKTAIDDLKHEVFLGISGAILQALEGSTWGGRGSSAIHKNTSDIRKWHIASCVQDVVNAQFFPDIIDLNLAGCAYPRLTLGGVNDAEMASSLAVDVGLNRDLRLRLSKKDLYKRYGRPEPSDAADMLEPAALPAPSANGTNGIGLPGAGFAEPEVSADATFRGSETSWGYRFHADA